MENVDLESEDPEQASILTISSAAAKEDQCLKSPH